MTSGGRIEDHGAALEDLEYGARPPAIEPDLLIRACDVQVTLTSGLRRIKIQMDSGAWLYADVPPTAILTPNSVKCP